MVLNLGPLDLESSVLTTEPLLHEHKQGENQLTAIRKRTILHIISIVHDSIDLSNTLDKPLSRGGLRFHLL